MWRSRSRWTTEISVLVHRAAETHKGKKHRNRVQKIHQGKQERKEPADPQRVGAHRPRGLQTNTESLPECGTGGKSYNFILKKNLLI